MCDHRLYRRRMKCHVIKVITPTLKPAKQSHVDKIIALSYRLRDAHVLWQTAEKASLTDNAYTTWKFCVLLHKVLRLGPKEVIRDSSDYFSLIQSSSMRWEKQNNLTHYCIAAYWKVLYGRIWFLCNYENFSNNLDCDVSHIDDYGENCRISLLMDILDYQEHLNGLLFIVLSALDVQSLINSGDCRQTFFLAQALPSAVSDSDTLYGYAFLLVKSLCRQLPADTSSDLYKRFSSIYTIVQEIFDQISSMQMNFGNLFAIPKFTTTLCLDIPELALQEPTAPSLMDC
uniref:AP180 N-terminal homology (ANTH) domain-containing protein n=1 Tax=Glossina austeni TaxID=7395 RepID=A0A1A9UWF4_GLOAU